MGGMLVCGVLGDAMSREKNHTERSIGTAHHWRGQALAIEEFLSQQRESAA